MMLNVSPSSAPNAKSTNESTIAGEEAAFSTTGTQDR